jgi:hypothetical protein
MPLTDIEGGWETSKSGAAAARDCSREPFYDGERELIQHNLESYIYIEVCGLLSWAAAAAAAILRRHRWRVMMREGVGRVLFGTEAEPNNGSK